MRVVIEVSITRLEISGQLRASRVTHPAGVNPLVPVELLDRRIRFIRFHELLPPIDVRLHGTVTGLAADAHLGHRRGVGVGLVIVVLAQPGVVAGGALGIPAHAPASPMPPLARLPILFAVDIEPLVLVRIVGRIERLEAAARKGNQILPNRSFSNHTFDGK